MPRPNEGYLTSDAAPNSLDAMDDAYRRRQAGPPQAHAPFLFHRLKPVNWVPLWGEPGTGENELRAIGERGRIWALSFLLVRYGPVPPVASTIAMAACDKKGADASLIAQIEAGLRAAGKPKDVAYYLQSLISSARIDGFPPGHMAEEFSELLLRFGIRELCAGLAEETAKVAEAEFRAAFESVADKPSAMFERLLAVAAKFADPDRIASRRRARRGDAHELGGEDLGRSWKAQLSSVDAAIDHKLVDPAKAMMPPDEEDRGDNTVKQILHALDNSRLIIVSGEPLLGKKTKVKGVLRILASESGQLVYTLREQSDKLVDYLPVLVLSAGAQSYRDLVDKVATFLQDYEAEALKKGLRPVPRRRRPGQFDEAVEDLFAEYRSRPVLVVISDVEAFEFDRTRQAIRDTGIRRLIEALLAANRHSRVLITTTDQITDDQARDDLAPRKTKLVPVPAPNTSDLKMFVAPQIYDRLPSELVDTAAEIRGDDLVALAALGSLAYDPSARGQKFSEDELWSVTAFLAEPRGERNTVRRPIYRSLIARIARWDLLHPLALIAASHDGVRDDSLRRLLTLWSQYDADATPDCGPVETRLGEFRQVAGDRFLRRSHLPRYDPEEYAPSEKHSEGDQVWDLDPSVAYWFLKMLDETRPDVVAASHRLIAGIARERAQNKKLGMRSPSGSRVTEDAPRDVQAYTSLLASIRFDGDAVPSIAGPPLRTCEDDMFSIDPRRFNPARALRFAAYSLLREDIDHDHRLSMLFDEDSLRLDLYLLLLSKTGRQHATKLDPLGAPDELPKHLFGDIFEPGEVLDFLSTAALSAYHSQRFAVLANIVRLADKFAKDAAAGEDVAAKLSRLWCSQIDAYILLGGPSAEKGHAATLAELRKVQKRFFPGIGRDVKKLFASEPKLARLKAFMRMLAREGELYGLIDPTGPDAQACYASLDALEAVFSTSTDQHDPIVVNGRVARRYLRYLLSDGGIARQRAEGVTEEQTIARVRGLLSVNTSRLRRFSGAERVGVMLDHARVALFASECAERRGATDVAASEAASAKTYADTANRRAFSGSASHATRLDVLGVQSEANRRYAELELIGAYEKVEHSGAAIEWAGIAAHDLLKMAEGLRARPTLGLACYLEGAVLLVEDRYQRAGKSYRGKKNVRALEDGRKKLREARKFMAAIGDKSLDSRIAILLEETTKANDGNAR